MFCMSALICCNSQNVRLMAEAVFCSSSWPHQTLSKLQHFDCKQLLSIKYTAERTNTQLPEQNVTE